MHDDSLDLQVMDTLTVYTAGALLMSSATSLQDYWLKAPHSSTLATHQMTSGTEKEAGWGYII
jgi:hypothetical protein